MYNFTFLEGVSKAFFDFCNYIIQIRIRDLFPGSGSDLDDKDRIYVRIVLLIGILIPVLTFTDPFIRRSLENSHIAMFCGILRIRDHNPVF